MTGTLGLDFFIYHVQTHSYLLQIYNSVPPIHVVRDGASTIQMYSSTSTITLNMYEYKYEYSEQKYSEKDYEYDYFTM